jgi:hypothetical protein
MVEIGRPLIFPKMALMMYLAMLRDLCRWVYGVQLCCHDAGIKGNNFGIRYDFEGQDRIGER